MTAAIFALFHIVVVAVPVVSSGGSGETQAWSEFRSHAIDGIGGMTMNERLHWFGLFQRLDDADTEEARTKIYAKLLARP